MFFRKREICLVEVNSVEALMLRSASVDTTVVQVPSNLHILVCLVICQWRLVTGAELDTNLKTHARLSVTMLIKLIALRFRIPFCSITITDILRRITHISYISHHQDEFH